MKTDLYYLISFFDEDLCLAKVWKHNQYCYIITELLHTRAGRWNSLVVNRPLLKQNWDKHVIFKSENREECIAQAALEVL